MASRSADRRSQISRFRCNPCGLHQVHSSIYFTGLRTGDVRRANHTEFKLLSSEKFRRLADALAKAPGMTRTFSVWGALADDTQQREFAGSATAGECS